MSKEEQSIPKIVLYANGNVNVDEGFPQASLVGILRQEYLYQKEIQKIRVEEQVREDIKKQQKNPPDKEE